MLDKLKNLLLQATQYIPVIGGVLSLFDAKDATKIQQTATVVQSDIQNFFNVVVAVQAAGAVVTGPGVADGGLSGDQKLQAATPLIGQAVLASAFMVGKKIADPAMFQLALSQFATATHTLTKSLHPDSVGDTVNKA